MKGATLFSKAMSTTKGKSILVYSILSGIVLLGTFILFLILWPNVINLGWSMFRATWIIFLPVIALVILGIVLIDRSGTWSKFSIGTYASFGAAFVYLAVSPFVVHYSQMSAVSDSVVISEESPSELSFRDRAPFDVAAATSSRALGNTTGDTNGNMRSLPALGDRGEYSTAVIRRGFLQGYESVQMLNIPLFGSADVNNVSFCKFSEDANYRFGGMMPSNSMATAIARKTPLGTVANANDAILICEGEGENAVPMVYAPLTKQEGFAITKRVPAGVAIYNGKTGELVIEENYKGDIPVYPESIAQTQRESMKSSEGFIDWVFGRAGFEDTSKDADDPNGDNRAEFGLADEEGIEQFYVTPLNARGSSSSIVAVGTTEATVMEAGKLNEYVVRVYPDNEVRQANSSVADTITGGALSGYQAQGLTVFEVIPSIDGNWMATIGKKQSILYRAYIEPNGTVTLRDAKGQQVGAIVTPGGDVEQLPAEEGTENLPIQESSLSTMTEEELKTLGNQVLEELTNRASAGE